jgi:hypothetical protein
VRGIRAKAVEGTDHVLKLNFVEDEEEMNTKDIRTI